MGALPQRAHAGADRVLTTARSEVALYADSDAVTVLTPALSGSVEEETRGWSAAGSYLADIVSAASVDIVSTASPRWTEVRHEAALEVAYRPGDVRGSIHGGVSSEPDFLSVSGGGAFSWAVANKMATPTLSYTYSHDTAGRTGTPFSVFSKVLERHTLSAGAELILGPATALTLTLNTMLESGEQEKPYRFLPVFEAGVASSLEPGASLATVSQLRLPARMTESLPGGRQRFALSGRVAHRFDRATLVVSDRLYADDWGLLATTLDGRLGVDVGRRLFPWLHLRGHVQSGVAFWERAYVAKVSMDGTSTVPSFRTGDRELGPLRTITAGAGGRWLFGGASKPSRFALVVQGDVLLTSFPDALYVTGRTGLLAITQLEFEP